MWTVRLSLLNAPWNICVAYLPLHCPGCHRNSTVCLCAKTGSGPPFLLTQFLTWSQEATLWSFATLRAQRRIRSRLGRLLTACSWQAVCVCSRAGWMKAANQPREDVGKYRLWVHCPGEWLGSHPMESFENMSCSCLHARFACIRCAVCFESQRLRVSVRAETSPDRTRLFFCSLQVCSRASLRSILDSLAIYWTFTCRVIDSTPLDTAQESWY